MAKKKINKHKAVVSTLWWTAIYFTLILYYVYHTTGINLLNISEWQYKYDGFIAGQWSMSTSDTLLLLCAIILFIPIWIGGSMMLYKINWSLPKFTRIREKSFKNKLILKQQDIPVSRLKMPIKLKMQSSGLTTVDTPTLSPTIQPNTNSTSDAVLNTVEKDERDIENIAKQILEASSQYQVEGFLNLSLEGIQIPLALSTEDDTALLITIINEPDSFLTTDINNDIFGDWFSTLGPIPSPVKLIHDATKKLRELENEAGIIPIIVLAGGELDDCQNITQILSQNDIILTRFGQGGPAELETIEDFFNKTLDKKEESSDTEQINIPEEILS